MYGPPPDPAQVLAPTGLIDAPGPWAACVFVGIAVMMWATRERPFLWILGAVIALTTPFTWYLPTYVYGAFPTIDKAGSLFFYGQGVHWRVWDATHEAVQLIGVQLGHLWITAAFDLVLEPFSAMNAHVLLNLTLNWMCAYLLFRELGAERDASLLMAFPFALGLHVFRDINWYTIEKSGVWWLPLYAWALLRARTGPLWLAPVVYAGMFFYNAYWGVLGAAMGALALLSRQRRIVIAVNLSALAALPIVIQQFRIMAHASFATEEQFLHERAALDTITLWPPYWNRLEGWRALDMVALAFALGGIRKTWPYWLVAIGFAAFALGPVSPVYMVLHGLIPGFWRFAKPEVFFEVAWLAILAAAALTLSATDISRRTLAAIMLAGWIVSVRTHPVYPSFTKPTAVARGTLAR